MKSTVSATLDAGSTGAPEHGAAGAPRAERDGKGPADLIVLSHLGWDFVWQRPQHLMTHAAEDREVYFVETPHFEPNIEPWLERRISDGVTVCKPHVPVGHNAQDSQRMTARLVAALARELDGPYDLWVYTPMEIPVADLLEPRLVIYDCMDQLSQFRFAPPELVQRETELLRRAHVVFTGGHRLHEAKSQLHDNAHPFPSSVDVEHFRSARARQIDPADQANLPHPRLGYCGVIDERLDYDLIASLAAARPEWEIILVGPVVKVDPADLPRAANLHYLGGKHYDELPEYLSHWDVALMPFALNEATEFISPTKTPEYLAAGLPVVSTAIRDVVRPWGEEGLVAIAGTADEFEQACAAALAAPGTDAEAQRRAGVDRRLATMSWRRTWEGMDAELTRAVAALDPGA